MFKASEISTERFIHIIMVSEDVFIIRTEGLLSKQCSIVKVSRKEENDCIIMEINKKKITEDIASSFKSITVNVRTISWKLKQTFK